MPVRTTLTPAERAEIALEVLGETLAAIAADFAATSHLPFAADHARHREAAAIDRALDVLTRAGDMRDALEALYARPAAVREA